MTIINKFLECDEVEATHVSFNGDQSRIVGAGVTKGKVYPLFYTDDKHLIEGEEYIIDDAGHYRYSFSLALKTEWLKQIS